VSHPCIVLVPAAHHIEPRCEDGLRELERRGYVVRRVFGQSAIDAARCQLATAALAEGFAELMWIDSDIGFEAAAVDRLRAHPEPFVCGLYAKRERREFAVQFLPGTRNVLFGPNGRLHEVRYCGFGFTLTRRAVFEAVRERCGLPVCNRQFGPPLVPYFQPLIIPDPSGAWYLAEDYAFCERARRCGFRIYADTTFRLWHVGSYGYSWEDAGSDKDRYQHYTFDPTPSPG
jgi:hypothetical protein